MQWKTWTGAVAVAAAMSVAGLFAQAPLPSSASSQKAGDPGAAGTVTVTGCLAKGEMAGAAATGTTGTRGSEAASYILRESPPASTTGSTGTTGTMRAPTYMLEGHESDLSAHVNHEIEVKGTIARASATGAPSSRSATSSMPSGEQTLKVDSVRMIASTCSR